MKKIILLLIFLGNYAVALGQTILGRVTLEELKEEKDLIYPEADASILNEEGVVFFDYVPNSGFKMVQTISRKLKVYTKDGISYADLSIPYFNGNGVVEQVKIEEVITYNANNGKIEQTKLKSNAIFDDKKDEKWRIKKVIIPDVKEGSIVEYRYTVTSDYFNVIPPWNFQRSIPIRKSTYVVKVPEYLVYTTRLKGNIPVAKENKVETKNIKLTTTYPYKEMRMSESMQKYTVSNVMPIKEEPYLDNIENYRSSIQFDLSMVSYANQKTKVISLSEQDLIKNIYENKSFKDQLQQTKYFEKSINLKDFEGLSEEEKTRKVLNFVKNNISWNAKNGYLTVDGVKKAFENKTGNVAEINLMLTSMLRYVGLISDPILVSTVNNGIDLSLQKTSFNRVLSSVEIKGNVLLLDGTSKYTDLNIVPISNLNWIGILIKNEKEFKRVNMIPNFYSISSESFILNLDDIETNESGLGQAMFAYKDYIAAIARTDMHAKSEEEISNKLEKSYENINVKGIRIYNQDDVTKAFNMRFSFDKLNVISKIGQELYFNPMQFYDLKSNPFKAVERTMPISFQFPYIDLYTMTLTVPTAYEVEYLPERMELIDEKVGLKALYNIEYSNGKVVCSLEFSKGIVIIETENYVRVKQFYEKLIEKLTEQVIFKKK